MVTELRIYFEGDKALRQGFLTFLGEIYNRARLQKCRIGLIATGATPVEDYRIAVTKHREAWNILILDSDCPDDGILSERFCKAKGLDISWWGLCLLHGATHGSVVPRGYRSARALLRAKRNCCSSRQSCRGGDTQSRCSRPAQESYQNYNQRRIPQNKARASVASVDQTRNRSGALPKRRQALRYGSTGPRRMSRK